MRKWLVLISSSMLMLSPLSAFAADMPVKAQPAPVIVDSWTGFYVGLNAGGTLGRQSSNSYSSESRYDGVLGPLLCRGRLSTRLWSL